MSKVIHEEQAREAHEHYQPQIDALIEENNHLRDLLRQWAGNCTGMHGSQNRCGLLPEDFTRSGGSEHGT